MSHRCPKLSTSRNGVSLPPSSKSSTAVTGIAMQSHQIRKLREGTVLFFHCLFFQPLCATRNQITSFIKYLSNHLLLNQSHCLYCDSRLCDLCLGHLPILSTPVTTTLLYCKATLQCSSDPAIPSLLRMESEHPGVATQPWSSCSYPPLRPHLLTAFTPAKSNVCIS